MGVSPPETTGSVVYCLQVVGPFTKARKPLWRKLLVRLVRAVGGTIQPSDTDLYACRACTRQENREVLYPSGLGYSWCGGARWPSQPVNCPKDPVMIGSNLSVPGSSLSLQGWVVDLRIIVGGHLVCPLFSCSLRWRHRHRPAG